MADKTKWFAQALEKEYRKKYGDSGNNKGAERDIKIQVNNHVKRFGNEWAQKKKLEQVNLIKKSSLKVYEVAEKEKKLTEVKEKYKKAI